MADVFISYKREERPLVERLAAAIRALGLSVWFDAGLTAGESFSAEIDREVRAATAVLVCWSPLAAASKWVKAEAEIGFNKGNLLAVHAAGPDGFEPPYPFGSTHYEDLRAWLALPEPEREAPEAPGWKNVLRRLGALCKRADIADWGALPAGAEHAALKTWLDRHGATSPLLLVVEAAYQAAHERERAKDAALAAARQRLARQAAEAAAKRKAVLEVYTRRALIGTGVVAAAGGGIFVLRALPGLLTQRPAAETLRADKLFRLNHPAGVTSAAFSPDGTRIVTAFNDKTAIVWALKS